jgi:hypothetical protein
MTKETEMTRSRIDIVGQNGNTGEHYTEEETLLWKVPRNSMINLNGTLYKFYHVDGMYSYCKNMDGEVVHLAAYTPVKVVGKLEET